MVELIEQAQWIVLDTLKLWSRNYNQGDVGAISNSIKRFGFNKSVRAWNGVVMAGNHSIKALRQLQADGWQPSGGGLRVIDGDWYVSVIDVSHLSEQEAEAFAVADNRTAELASHDDVALAELLQEMALADMALMRDAGYDGDDLDMLLAELGAAYDDPTPDPGVQIDRAAELQVKWQTERGQVWQVGAHRIMCGDSTDAGDVARLMGGAKAQLMVTDPPYGINVVKAQNDFGTADSGGSKPVTIGVIRSRRPYPFGGIKNRATVGGTGMVDATLYRPVHGDDKPFDPSHLIDLADDLILFGGNYFASKLWDTRCWIVWDKNNTGNFADAELAWTSFDRGVKLYQFTWNGLVREGSRDIEGIKRFHPTQKPVGLFFRILSDFSKPGDTILDVYLGSGTTLIACEQTGRVGYGMEIDAAYVAVALERLTGMGLEAELEK